MIRKPAVSAHEPVARTLPPGELNRAGRAVDKAPADPRPSRADSTWLASSFDLAQGLEVKVMDSKLSWETLDRLFRS